jgi:hypothetical protein
MSTLRTVGGAGTDEKIRLVVKMLLAAHGMTTLELGRELGLGRTPIYDRMQGRKPFTVAEVAAMAERFAVPVAVLFGGPTALLGQSEEGTIRR